MRQTCTLAALGAAWLASVALPAAAGDGSGRTEREHHACAIMLGLDPSQQSYATCMNTLDRALPVTTVTGERPVSRNHDGRLSTLQQASLACADLGFDPGSDIFRQCVADLDRSLENAPAD